MYTNPQVIFWRKNIETHIKPLTNLRTDRMCVIKILTAKSEKDIIFVGVYMPHRTCKIANYDDEIEKLEEIVKNAYTGECHIVVMGDINAHFGVEVDDRCWRQTSTNAKKFIQFMNRNDMILADVKSSGQGPVYTFQDSRGSQTYIDHSIISINFKSSKIKSQVHLDHFLNCSDHLSIELVIPALNRNQCEHNLKSISNEYIAWERFKDQQINALYTASLESETSTILFKIEVVNSNRGIVCTLNEMQKDSEFDQKKFWKYVNKTRENRKNISLVADIDGSLITDPDDVVKDWGQYFEQLFANDDTEQGYDENLKKTCES